MTEFKFLKGQHLRAKSDFERVYGGKCKAADGVLLLFAMRNGMGITRIGLSVSRKHGGAVIRNRGKRLLREAFRLEQHRIPNGLDLIAIPLDMSRATLPAYRESLVTVSNRLKRKLNREAQSETDQK